MYKTGRVLAAGTKFLASLAGTPPLVQIAGVVAIGGPDMTAESVDMTELDPYEGTSTLPTNPEFFKEFQAGWRDTGSVTLTLNFTRTQWSTMLTWYRRGNDLDMSVQLRNQDALNFSGHIAALGKTHEIGGLVQVPVTLKVTGAPAFVAGP